MAQNSDVCLLLEGTYPYVRGGVSSWVHQLIKGMPHLRFHLVFIGGTRAAYGKPYFQLPDNVVGLETYYLMEPDQKAKPRARRAKQGTIDTWYQILTYFQTAKSPLNDDHMDYLLNVLGKDSGFTREDFLYSEQSWEVLTEIYSERADQQSFVDYFWTFRNVYSPLFTLAQIARKTPYTGMVHSISTGFAGFLGAMIKQHQKIPYLLSEHGIYTKERKIDLTQASWIKDRHSVLDKSIHRSMEQTRQMWITFFEQLGRSAYSYANEITALYEGNRQRQVKDGAAEHKTHIIVNGIDLERFKGASSMRSIKPPRVAGLIGRVVPIKDIKTFIRAITTAVEKDPSIEGWIIGPTEEDEAYHNECEALVASLGMDSHIKFLGMQDISKILPKIGVCVLTSISEAQPLVLLEAMACGIPCVATDVGACREILYGMHETDESLGKCGLVVDIASPEKIANSILACLESPTYWRELGDTGLKRVKSYYQESDMYARFGERYKGLLAWRE